ncbi:hypothetical protein GGR54DRAFT_619514 [Hypoxylon sp. NC1633]|nr:hypothetical protein GGR54DRAFT_619514 [Hypoxylon sp. NC1633]
MAENSAVQSEDYEVISLYFDLDQASVESSQDSEAQNGSQIGGEIDRNIPGFRPIIGRQDNRCRRAIPRINFSGGICCYSWPWSPQVMMGSEALPVGEARECLEINRKVQLGEEAMHETMEKRQTAYLPSMSPVSEDQLEE